MMQFKQYPVDPQEIFTNRLEDEDYKRVEVVRKPWTPIAEPDRCDIQTGLALALLKG